MSLYREPGGKNWADALFRGSASNQEYIQAILDRTQKVEKTVYVQPEKRIEAYFGRERFVLVYDDKIVWNKSYQFVDGCRSKSPFDFDEEVQRLVQSLKENNAEHK